MSQGAEPSMIDYARFYGLIRDHLGPHPLQAVSNSLLAQQSEDTADLFQIHLENIRAPEERLAVDAGSTSLLSSIATLAKGPPSRDDEDDGICTHRVSRMKHELPLLRSDHELDVICFATQIVPDLENEFLPLEPVDEEADEGFTWPTKCHELPDIYDRKSKSEKLEVSTEGLLFLQESLRYHSDGGVHEVFEVEVDPYKKKTIVEHVSPPLLPLSPEILPYVPSSETGHLDLLSDHTSPTRDEALQVERMFFNENAIALPRKHEGSSSQCSDPMLLESDSLGDIYSPLKGIKDPPSSPPPLRAPLQDRKVEVPLEPAEVEQPPPWKKKSVTFSEALHELIPNLPLPIPSPENVSSSDIDTYFAEVIAPIAIKAERAIEQEQLQEADTMLRVNVPIMDFTLPVAPWKASLHAPHSRDGDKLFKQTMTEMKALHFSKHVWPICGKGERELKWAPFPAALGKVETQESISDNGSLEKYLAQPDRVDVSTLTWKPEGLRILDELRDDGEEDLKEGTFPEERDMKSLIRKRKLELEAYDLDSSSPSRVSRAEKEIPPEKTVFPEKFLSSNALDSYLNVRKGVIKEPKSDHFPIQAAAEGPKPSTRPDSPHKASDTVLQPSIPANHSLPSPDVIPPTNPYPFVISASSLNNRKLSRQIQRLFPSAEFIERDFNLYLDPSQRPPSMPNTPPVVASTMADEADMILSPSTGLIWTTLQKIKQRSLPGQAARSAMREKILGASPRYEKLLVLVSEDRGETDGSDCEALVEFIAFCSSLQDEVQVTFIAGGEDELAKWIVAMMVTHATTEVKLIQDESLWEIFLRRAGINAFAAQAILGKLKAPDQDNGKSSGDGHWRDADFGLTAFVKMSFEEREARFETLLGGRRLLGRVSKGMDARW